MSVQVTTALISGAIALAVASIGGLITWAQVQRERIKWLVDLKTAYTLEIYKARLNSYPELLEIMSKVSSRAVASVTASEAESIAAELNTWFYSVGGLCADSRTRGAVLALRQSCDVWAVHDTRPKELYQIRNAVLIFMRRDLDLGVPESYDFSNASTLLAEIQADIDEIQHKKKPFRWRLVSTRRGLLFSKETSER
jgi:hypothetical protein